MKKLTALLTFIILVFTVCSASADGIDAGSPLVQDIVAKQAVDATTLVVGQSYNVTYTITNNTGGSMPIDSIFLAPGSSFPTGSATKPIDNCSGHTLENKGICTWSIRLNPETTGSQTFNLHVNYGEGAYENIPLAEFTGTGINATVTDTEYTPLPTVTNVGISYPVVIQFQNHTGAPLDKLSYTESLPDGMNVKSFNCASPLPIAGTCSFQAQFTPSEESTYILSLTYMSGGITNHINEQTKAGDNAFTSTVTALPATIDVGSSYTVQYTLSNHSGKAATITSISSTSTKDFTPASAGSPANTCEGQTIQASQTCVWTGTLTPSEVSSYTVLPTITFANGATETLGATSASAQTTGVDHALTTALPGDMLIGGTYTTTYTITNNLNNPITLLPITNLNNDFKIAPSTTCKDTIEPTKSCQYSFTFKPTNTISYALQPEVNFHTQSGTHEQLILQGQHVAAKYPDVSIDYAGDNTTPTKDGSIVTAGKIYVLSYNINNNSAQKVTIVNESNLPSEGLNISNDCKNIEIAVGSSCEWKAEFTPQGTTSYDFNMSATTKTGHTILFPAVNNLTSSPIHLDIEPITALPSTIKSNSDVSFTYKLTNNDAAAITLTDISMNVDALGTLTNTSTDASCINNGTINSNAFCTLTLKYNPGDTSGTITFIPSLNLNNGAKKENLAQLTTQVTDNPYNISVVDDGGDSIPFSSSFEVSYQLSDAEDSDSNLTNVSVALPFILKQTTNTCSPINNNKCTFNGTVTIAPNTKPGNYNWQPNFSIKKTDNSQVTLKLPLLEKTITLGPVFTYTIITPIPTSISATNFKPILYSFLVKNDATAAASFDVKEDVDFPGDYCGSSDGGLRCFTKPTYKPAACNNNLTPGATCTVSLAITEGNNLKSQIGNWGTLDVQIESTDLPGFLLQSGYKVTQ